MHGAVKTHYGISGLAERIAAALRSAGKDLDRLTTADLASIDEFHIRGRKATLEMARHMELTTDSRVLDIGSGLGGPARTLAETYGCHVTGIDLSPEFCDTARQLSQWVGLSDQTTYSQSDATALPFDAQSFDAAMTIHVAMNIAAKDVLYAGVRRVLRPGRIFAVYDILQGEGGEIAYPVPWAREPSISHLATPPQMRDLLQGAGFQLLQENDSTEEGEAWFRQAAARAAVPGQSQVGLRQFLGDDAAQMLGNQLRNLSERRIRAVTFICRS